MFGQLGDAVGRNPDRRHGAATSRKLRDEGFRRVWMSQMPYEPDLLTILAVALREVDDIEVASGGACRSRTSIRCRWRSAR